MAKITRRYLDDTAVEPKIEYDFGPSNADVVLPEVVVMPRGAYTNYTGNETTAPSLEDFVQAKQRQHRLEAVHNMLNTVSPSVPVIPSRNKLSKLFGKFGMSDENRIKLFGREPLENIETCLYTATNKYNDKGAIVPGNVTFYNDPKKYGFVPVPLNRQELGDIIQYYGDKPHHGTIQTGINIEGEPVVSYSNGDTRPIYEDGTSPIKKDIEAYGEDLLGLGEPIRYRYIGSPQQQGKWKREYYGKYDKPRYKIKNKKLLGGNRYNSFIYTTNNK